MDSTYDLFKKKTTLSDQIDRYLKIQRSIYNEEKARLVKSESQKEQQEENLSK